MELSWLETVQLLGLDVMAAVVLAMVLADAVGRLLAGIGRAVLRRQRRSARLASDAEAHDPWPPQEWRPSH
jgi:hypothetical protein